MTILGLEFSFYVNPNILLPTEKDGIPFLQVKDEQFMPLNIYCDLLGACYLYCRQANIIDGWIWDIQKHMILRTNEAYFGDNVCVFFEGHNVRLISYCDYAAGKDSFCQITVEELLKLTVDWKWFVVEWEIKCLTG